MTAKNTGTLESQNCGAPKIVDLSAPYARQSFIFNIAICTLFCGYLGILNVLVSYGTGVYPRENLSLSLRGIFQCQP